MIIDYKNMVDVMDNLDIVKEQLINNIIYVDNRIAIVSIHSLETIIDAINNYNKTTSEMENIKGKDM